MTRHWLDRVVAVLKADTADLRELALMCREDPTNFYLGATLNGVDMRGQDLRGLGFTNLEGAGVIMDAETRLGAQESAVVEPEPAPPEEESAQETSVFCTLDIGVRGVACGIFQRPPLTRSIADFRMAAFEFIELADTGTVALDAKQLARTIGLVVERAERSAGIPVSGAVVATSLGRIDSQRHRGRISLGWAPVSDADLARAIAVALAEVRLPDRRPLHILPLHWSVDDGPRTRDPRGVKGVNLEVDILLVSIEESAFRLVSDAIEAAHLDLRELAAAPLAEALAAVSPKAVAGHTICLDLGTTYVGATVFAEGSIVHIGSLPYGLDQLADSVSRKLGQPFVVAQEALRLLAGAAVIRSSDALMVGTESYTANLVMDELLTAVSEALGEQFTEVIQHLSRRGIPTVGASVVVTGALAQLAEAGAGRRSALGGSLRVHRPDAAAVGAGQTIESLSAEGLIKRALRGPREAVSASKLLARTPVFGQRNASRSDPRVGRSRRR